MACPLPLQINIYSVQGSICTLSLQINTYSVQGCIITLSLQINICSVQDITVKPKVWVILLVHVKLVITVQKEPLKRIPRNVQLGFIVPKGVPHPNLVSLAILLTPQKLLAVNLVLRVTTVCRWSWGRIKQEVTIFVQGDGTAQEVLVWTGDLALLARTVTGSVYMRKSNARIVIQECTVMVEISRHPQIRVPLDTIAPLVSFEKKCRLV